MRRSSLAIIDISDEYMRALLSPLDEKLELNMPEAEPLAIEQYDTRSQHRVGLGYGKPTGQRRKTMTDKL